VKGFHSIYWWLVFQLAFAKFFLLLLKEVIATALSFVEERKDTWG
jgi:hypothetical protein